MSRRQSHPTVNPLPTGPSLAVGNGRRTMDPLTEAQATDVLGRPEAGLIVDNGRQAEPHEVEAVNGAFAVYLQQYTALSLNLFGRWPAFVPPEEQSLERLQTASNLASTAPPLPAALQSPPRPRWGNPLPGGASAASSRRGSKLGPSGATSRRGSHATVASSGGTSSARGADEESLAGEIVAEAEAREAVLRDQIGRMSEKLRTESSRKNSAADDSLHKAVALDAARHHISTLDERSSLLTEQLSQEKARTLTLERTLRAAQTSERAANASAASERKQRFRLEVRLDRLDKSVEPLRHENERRGGVMLQADAARRSAEARMAAAEQRAAEVEAHNASLQKRLNSAQERFLASKDSAAGSLAEVAEAADKVEDAEEARLEAEEAARGLVSSLAETRTRLADSRANESRASSASAAAAARAAAAELALELAREEAAQMGADLAAARAAEALANELLEEATRQQAHTREQQSGLFGVLSELLARVLYLKAVPAEMLCMGNNELMRHEADAVRHLKSIRDAALRDHLNTDVVCAPPTVAAGAAVLKAAAAATPGAPDLADWKPPEGTFISRVEPVAALSPRARRRANAAAAEAAAAHASSPRLALPRSPRHSLAEAPAAATREVKQSPRRGGAVAGQVRPMVDPTGAAEDASRRPTPRALKPGSGAQGRHTLPGPLPVAPRSESPLGSPRGPRAKKVAKSGLGAVGPQGAGGLLQATEWEKKRLLELMHDDDVFAGLDDEHDQLGGGGGAAPAGAGSVAAMAVRSGAVVAA